MTDAPPSDLLRAQARSSLRDVSRVLQAAAVLALLGYALSGIRTVQPSEVGVRLHFGRVVHADLKSGMHFALPWPIGRIERVSVKSVSRMVVDDLSANLATETASGDFYKRTGLKSYCLTGDNNLVHLSFAVQYLVADPVDYLYSIRDHELLLRHVATDAAIHVIAGMAVEDVLTVGKATIAQEILRDATAALDALETGIGIASVELTDVSPPSGVQGAFDDVVNAQLEARQSVSEAESYRNSALPEAQGEATRLREQGRAYKQRQIAYAQGETERFRAQLAEYHKAPGVSRHRLYLDFLTRVYPAIHTKIVVQERDGEPIGDVRLQGTGRGR